MSDTFTKYARYFEKGSYDLILESAADDTENISDAQYEKLLKLADKNAKDRKTKNHVKRMADRDLAASIVNPRKVAKPVEALV